VGDSKINVHPPKHALLVEYVMVMAEERDLVIRFGQAYVDYRRRTGAFLPRRQG
jgi:protein-S-isoprenylcysteine O-methyltransferase Ste14